MLRYNKNFYRNVTKNEQREHAFVVIDGKNIAIDFNEELANKVFNTCGFCCKIDKHNWYIPVSFLLNGIGNNRINFDTIYKEFKRCPEGQITHFIEFWKEKFSFAAQS